MAQPVPQPARMKSPAPVPFHILTEPELFSALDAAPGGLTSDEAAARLERYGHNDISPARKRPVLLQFLSHLKNLLI
ncbi:MAG TPA: cation-transporting P-type ATPase, partial [Methanoregula sp.]|nr:cation-transporting P-type ATPase [Methanoregula sp.]